MGIFGRKTKVKSTKTVEQKKSSPAPPVEKQVQTSETPVAFTVSNRSKGSKKPESQLEHDAQKNPDWHTELKEMSGQFEECQQKFSSLKDSIKGISDRRKLDEMKMAAKVKFDDLSKLKIRADHCYQKITEGTENKNNTPEAEDEYKSFTSKAESCTKLYETLMGSITSRIEEIKTESKLAKKNSIIERFRVMKKETPMMLLIKQVRLIQKKSVGTAAVTDKDDDKFTKISELGEESLSIIEKIYDFSDEGNQAVNDTRSFVRKLKDEAPKEDNIGEIFEKVTSVKEIAKLIKEVVDYLKNYSKMTEDGKIDGLVSIVTKGLTKTADIGEKILEEFSNIPIIGGIMGLIKNAINFFSEGYTFYKSQKRMDRIRKEKTKLKEKMLRRQSKVQYQIEQGNQYSFMSKKNGSAHVDKKKLGDRETRKDTGNGSAARQAIKNAGSKNEEYYTAKTAETIEQYDEMKEAVHKNKNVRSAATISLIQEGVDVVANIASFFPGTGTIVQLGAKAVKSVSSTAHTVGSTVLEWGRSLFKTKRSSKNKKEFRGRYAEHIYDNLAEVAEYMDDSGELSLDSMTPDQAKGLEKSYDYAENMLTTLAADMPALIKAKSKDELLEKMGGAFSREG